MRKICAYTILCLCNGTVSWQSISYSVDEIRLLCQALVFVASNTLGTQINSIGAKVIMPLVSIHMSFEMPKLTMDAFNVFAPRFASLSRTVQPTVSVLRDKADSPVRGHRVGVWRIEHRNLRVEWHDPLVRIECSEAAFDFRLLPM
jgi:hypothetical protein